MILNSYALLLGFVAVLRLLLGAAVVGLGLAALGRSTRDAREDRSYLAFLLAGLLLVLNLLSWPLMYLLLQSYVPEWAGVMCVYGVTRVGENSEGVSRYLPRLLAGLQVSKPLLCFVGGGWFVLYLVNRRTATGPLLGRLFVLLPVLGTLAVGDAATELAYLGIPKKEDRVASGCCTQAFDDPEERYLQGGVVGDRGGLELSVAFYAGNAALVFAVWRASRGAAIRSLVGLAALAGVAAALGYVFLIDVAAPRLLRLPLHHCPYDLIPEVPEAVGAVGLYVLGAFCVGWALVVRALGRVEDAGVVVRQLLRVSAGCYLLSLAMLSVELLLA